MLDLTSDINPHSRPAHIFMTFALLLISQSCFRAAATLSIPVTALCLDPDSQRLSLNKLSFVAAVPCRNQSGLMSREEIS